MVLSEHENKQLQKQNKKHKLKKVEETFKKL